ncbi:DUF72 domain-containing protein [Flavobacterium rhizosphaerae]|uniref:DUF72 domain-containing protein n=1 Tax=Flavobacterium rhizosphaerae TaxID=3163298 RepID=A0ABW8Z2H8_9FLAO
MAGKIVIGTSGWSYKHWMGTFYPEGTKQKDRFAYYQSVFDTVELNAPFYHLPEKNTFEKWYHDVPDHFIYAIKASRYITHIKKLHDTADSLHKFLEHAAGLKDKLGVVLFQLPPRWGVNAGRLESFIKNIPKKIRCTFEFRDHSWYTEEVYTLLQKYNCAFCIYELGGHLSPVKVTADFVYIRLHGPGNKYQGNYSHESLKEWAQKCKNWAADGKDVYLYFDNDEKGYAAFNAKTIQQMVK